MIKKLAYTEEGETAVDDVLLRVLLGKYPSKMYESVLSKMIDVGFPDF